MPYRVDSVIPEQAFALGALYLQAARTRQVPTGGSFLDAWTDAWLRAVDRYPSWIAWSDDGQPCGAITFARCESLPQAGTDVMVRAHLDFLFSATEHRREGIATSLIKTSLSHLRRSSVTEVFCGNPGSARSLLLRAGFQPVAGGTLVFRPVPGPP